LHNYQMIFNPKWGLLKNHWNYEVVNDDSSRMQLGVKIFCNPEVQ